MIDVKITVEGKVCSGKTTVAAILYNLFSSLGADVLLEDYDLAHEKEINTKLISEISKGVAEGVNYKSVFQEGKIRIKTIQLKRNF